MSTIKTAIELEVKEPNLKGFRQQLRELTLAAQEAVVKFGEFSPEAREAERRVAELRDRMDDFNDRVAAVNPDKFAQLNVVVSGVARGFQAAQGAMALFGSESADLQKTLVKLQGAMALAEGLEGLGKVQQQFGAIASSIKGGVMNAFSMLGRMSLLTIGALGIGLSVVIANFDAIKTAIMNLIPGLKTIANIVGGLVQQFTDWVGITSAQNRALEKLNKNTEKSNQQLDREIALLQARGDQIGVFNKERQKLENDLAQARANYGKNTEKEWGKIILDTKNALEVLKIEEKKYIAEQAQAKAEADAEAKKKRDEEHLKRIEEEKKKQKELEDARLAAQDQVISAELAANETARQLRLAQTQDEGEKLKVEYENQLASLKESYIQQQIANAGNKEALALIDKQYADAQLLAEAQLKQAQIDLEQKNADKLKEIEDKKLEDKKKRAQEELQIEQQLRDAKLAIVQSGVEGITALSEILINDQDKLAKVRKGIALVEIAVDTGMAISSLNAEAAKVSAQMAGVLGPATPLFTAAYYGQGIARILANVAKAKQILTTKSPSTSGISGNSGNSVSPNISTPIPQMTTGSSLNENAQGGKVYVLEGDIRRTQQRVGMNRGVSVVE